MGRILIISPHFDDAALSCPGLVQRAVQRGHEVVVLTLFSESDQTQRSYFDGRKSEENLALRTLGARGALGGFLDAPYRAAWNAEGTGPVLASLEPHRALQKELSAKLVEQLHDLSPIAVVAPLGIGWHVDHVLAHEVAKSVVSASDCWFYEDKPYAFIRVQARLRFEPDPSFDFAAFWQEYVSYSFVKGLLDQLDPAAFESVWRKQLRSATPLDFCSSDDFTLSPFEVERASQSIRAYSSQWKWLFENKEQLETLYASTLERYWTSKANLTSLSERLVL